MPRTKTKKEIVTELLLQSVRIDELKQLRLQVYRTTSLVKHRCGENFTWSGKAVATNSMLISEIDLTIKRRERRSSELMVDLFKRSNKLFEEKPSELVPINIYALAEGYLNLTEVTDDGPVPHMLLLESGEIIPSVKQRAREVLAEGPNYQEFTKNKIHARMIML